MTQMTLAQTSHTSSSEVCAGRLTTGETRTSAGHRSPHSTAATTESLLRPALRGTCQAAPPLPLLPPALTKTPPPATMTLPQATHTVMVATSMPSTQIGAVVSTTLGSSKTEIAALANLITDFEHLLLSMSGLSRSTILYIPN